MKTDIEERLKTIERRNQRVEQDKAWEISWTRRFSIGTMTYLIVATYLIAINNDRPFINALVPPIGFLLSTLVLKRIRSLWQK